jgi:hypothetical protein
MFMFSSEEGSGLVYEVRVKICSVWVMREAPFRFSSMSNNQDLRFGMIVEMKPDNA